MSRVFLSAEWSHLLMANYRIDPQILQPHIPCHTELDDFNGIYYVSLVGFLFSRTRVFGISIPFHQSFEEVNLRFYVRCKEGGTWKRGVVFLKEIVPRRMITLVANTMYGEKYATHRMTHSRAEASGDLSVEYRWTVGREWNYLRAVAEKEPVDIRPGSEEEFISEHYWGYTHLHPNRTGVYEVKHAQWRVHPVKSYGIRCNTETVYGTDFVNTLSEEPLSVFLAEGSPIKVMKGSRMELAR